MVIAGGARGQRVTANGETFAFRGDLDAVSGARDGDQSQERTRVTR